MIDYKTVGQRIRAVRLQKKLTQEKLAEAAGVGVTHISHIETGNSIPSLQVTVDIVNALGCSMDELLCMEVDQARHVRDNWLAELVADCSDEEADHRHNSCAENLPAAAENHGAVDCFLRVSSRPSSYRLAYLSGR